MPSLKSILKPLETLSIPFGTEFVTVTFRPQYLTPEFEEKLKALNNDAQATQAFLDLFCSVIQAWDLRDDETDPQPIPVTPSALRPVPYDVLGEILNKVQEAVVPKVQKAPTYDDTLQPEVGSEAYLSGTA